MAKNIKSFVPESVIVNYHCQYNRYLTLICRQAKVADELDLINDNKQFFEEANDKQNNLRGCIYNIIKSDDDLYNVDFENFIIFFRNAYCH